MKHVIKTSHATTSQNLIRRKTTGYRVNTRTIGIQEFKKACDDFLKDRGTFTYQPS